MMRTHNCQYFWAAVLTLSMGSCLHLVNIFEIELTGPPLRAGVTWVWRAGNLSGLVPVESLQP